MTTPHGAVAPVAASLSDPALATIRARLPPLSPCPECGATSAHICTDGRWLTPVPEGRDDARTLLAAHEALADALRAAEARAVAAESSVAQLRADLERADGERYARDLERDTMEAQRDAAVTAHAALAAAVRAERALTSQYEGAWAAHIAADDLDAAEGVLAMSDRLDAARITVDALLRGAPGGYVEARVVREYLAALDVLPGDLATINAAIDRERTARTALDAALLAATTTPEESL